MKKAIFLPTGETVFVDSEDFSRVSAHRWHKVKSPSGRPHAATTICVADNKWKKFRMSRFILGVKDKNVEVDHIDGDSLNNTRINLRPLPKGKNQQGARRKKLGTTSRYVGVSWVKDSHRWTARIQRDGRRITLGHFDTEKEAAQKRDAWILEHGFLPEACNKII